MVTATAGRTPVFLSVFKPLVVVDAVRGQWFAVVADGHTKFQVLEWPLQDYRLDVDASTVIRIKLYLAEDKKDFLSGNGQMFAEVHVPAAKVREAPQGGLYRGWLGLQRGCHHDEVNADDAAQLYEAGVQLAYNLLTPKICCSVFDTCLKDNTPSSSSTHDARQAMLRRSVVQHGNIITHLHRQLGILWAKGKLGSVGGNNSNAIVQLLDAPPDDSLSAVFDEYFCPELSRLREEASSFAEIARNMALRLDESNRLRHEYREQLSRLTGEPVAEDPLLQECDLSALPPAQVAHHEFQELEEALQVAKAQVSVLQQQLEQERSRAEQLQQLLNKECALAEQERRHSAARFAETQDLNSQSKAAIVDARKREAEVSALRGELQSMASRLAEALTEQGLAARGQAGLRPADTNAEEHISSQARAARENCGCVDLHTELEEESTRLARAESRMLQEARRSLECEERAEKLQQEVDRMAGEAIVKDVKIQDQDSHIRKLRRELQVLQREDVPKDSDLKHEDHGVNGTSSLTRLRKAHGPTASQDLRRPHRGSSVRRSGSAQSARATAPARVDAGREIPATARFAVRRHQDGSRNS